MVCRIESFTGSLSIGSGILHPAGFTKNAEREIARRFFRISIPVKTFGVSLCHRADSLVRNRDTGCLTEMWVSGAEPLDNGFELSESLVS